MSTETERQSFERERAAWEMERAQWVVWLALGALAEMVGVVYLFLK